jgi:hypothetical protein
MATAPSSTARRLLQKIAAGAEMTGRELPDGRRFLSWDDPGPDLELPCTECGKPWAEHVGQAELLVLDGHVGRVLPVCPD